ncbi:OB-fold protein [Gaetbulibacter aestuarii]|uniref:tRNA_anti-like n=1 Tax=Gaetbulibacter aestuarii TaxID=1502358 RepID=A0ABW7N0K4_9FLAO
MKKSIAILIILIILGFIGYKYVYHDHRNIKEESAVFIVSSKELIGEFSSDPSKAEKKYLNKTIQVSGPVSSINDVSITLSGAVFCQFTNGLNFSPKENQSLKIKGRLIGYDDLLEEIKLDQCSVIN